MIDDWGAVFIGSGVRHQRLQVGVRAMEDRKEERRHKDTEEEIHTETDIHKHRERERERAKDIKTQRARETDKQRQKADIQKHMGRDIGMKRREIKTQAGTETDIRKHVER